MSSHNILLVTFPVDLGNQTLEANLKTILSNDAICFRFAGQHVEKEGLGRVSLNKSLQYRFRSALELRRVVRKYTDKGWFILFHGISPALFSYGAWRPEKTAIAVDWTRNLYPAVLGEQIKKNWVFYLHKKVLQDCQRIMCWTDAVKDNLTQIYGLEEASLFRVPMPFLIENLDMPPRPTPAKPRVLFVGGDLYRKGGDVLLEYWQRNLQSDCTLTMMTNDKMANISGVNFLSGIKYGSKKHRKTFEENDILVLPTRIDGYPQVIGEAAAAGLAVITTRFALGAKEVIINGRSGYIGDSPEDCMSCLRELLNNKSSIDNFKNESYSLMQERFCQTVIRNKHLKILRDSII